MVEKDNQIDGLCSLYIHIPFCVKKCDYCDFFSVPCKCVSDEYIESVINESCFYKNYYGIGAWKTVYIGGGTPSLLSPAQIVRLLNGIGNLSADCEVTIESNPDDLTKEFLDACAMCGVNRISVGIQALDDEPLEKVHRRCSRKSTISALNLLEKNWKGRLSCDLIAGLPGQSVESFLSGIEELATYRVEHVSLYTLTVEDQTPLAKNIDSGVVRWSQNDADKNWILGRNLLEKHGFNQYEVSNFAKSGCESRHNTTYWQLGNYIGCGSGATGTWYGARKEGGGCTTGIRWTNSKDISSYCSYWSHLNNNKIDDEKKLPRFIEKLSGDTQEFEYLMMGFRMISGVSGNMFYKRFGKNLERRIGVDGGVYAEWKKHRLTHIVKDKKNSDTCYALNKRGILLLNRFLEEV